MEILAQTEYQDMYRIKDGVLLVINKFEDKYPEHVIRVRDDMPEKKYGNGTQKDLRVLKYDHKYTPYHYYGHGNYYYDHSNYEDSFVIPKGTVTYCQRPVVPASDKSEWRYEIKTTGDMFRGDLTQITELLNIIQNIIEEENEQEMGL